jgi:hypothetical protein
MSFLRLANKIYLQESIAYTDKKRYISIYCLKLKINIGKLGIY